MRSLTLAGGVAGPPSACSSGPDSLDVFAVGPGNLVWRWSLNGTSWSPPAPLPAQGAIPAEGVCAVSSGPGRVEVFAAESGTRTPVWWRGNGGGWAAGPRPQGGANLPAEPVAAVCASPDDIDLFAAGAGNTPWWWHWNGSSWTLQGPLPGGNLPAERIAAVSPAPGRLDVFGVGANTHLWHWSRPANGQWSLEDLGGNLPAEGVSAVSWGLDRIDVFAASRQPGNPLQHWWWAGGGFTLEELGGSLAAGSVSAVSHAPDRLDVFGVSGDARLAHWQWDARTWTGPQFYGGGIPAGDVSAVVRKPHRLDVFATGAGNQVRQWPGGGLENATTQPWGNWPTNRNVAVTGHLRPDSLDELVTIVRQAEALGRGVRAVGSSWSNSDAAAPPAYVIETDALVAELKDVLADCLNATGAGLRLVHFEGGIKLYALNDILDRRDGGLALKTMGGSSGQSLAGVVSTSAHGMDVDRGPIPDMVRAIHLVGPGGVQHWIEPSAGITDPAALAATLGLDPANVHYDDDWFSSVLVSMGSMGIIYSLVVEVVPQYDLVNTCEKLDWAAMKTRLTGGPNSPFVPGNRGVQVAVNPYAASDGSRPCYLTTRQEAPATGAAPPGGPPSWAIAAFEAALLTNLQLNRLAIPTVVTSVTSQQQPVGTTRGTGHVVMGGPDPGAVRALTVAAAFDATGSTRYLDFVDAVLDILSSAFDEPGRLGYLGWISLRFQGRSRAYLSPHNAPAPTGRHARPVRNCTIECAAAWRIPELGIVWPDTPVLMDRIEAAVRQFGGRLHWGLNQAVNGDDVARGYPLLDAWRRVRWALTRGGTLTTFDNDFTRRCGLSDPPAPVRVADYGHDGRTDFSIWRASTGTWWVMDSDTGAVRSQSWGQHGDIPVPGHYDAATTTDFAIWRPSTGTWFVIDSSTGTQHSETWGQLGDIPV